MRRRSETVRPVVHAGSCAFEDVDGAELRNRPHQWIDAGREGASQRSGELPGGEGVDVVVSAEEVHPGIVVDRIGDLGWRGQIDVACSDQILTMNIHIGNAGGKAMRNFTFDV